MSTAGDRITQLLDEFRHSRDVMVTELNKVIIGQREVIELILAAIFTRGHVLLVGVPGLAKTLMVSSIARILDVGFKRIQFTPDLMPSDITGTNVLEEPEAGRRAFRFVPGPIFANIILADEINRTPPKTQAALLQAMQEREVTVGQETMHLPDPFFVIATQNPIEQEGTYPLPEAQLDRFMFDIRVGYPTLDEEKKILLATTKGDMPDLKKVLSGKAIVNLQKLVMSVPVSRVHGRLRGAAGAGDAAGRREGAAVHQGPGRLRRRAARRPEPDPGRQGHGGDGRPIQRLARRHPQGGRAGAAAPDQHQLPGPGGRAVDRILVQRLVSEIREPETPKYESASRQVKPVGDREDSQPTCPGREARVAGTAEKYLKPEVIRQVARLDLRAKFIVEGFISGLHASPFQGFSVEFSEHRKYTAGDNISDIDWNVYAKTDRFYIKKFQAETNLTGYLVMDLSGSMGYTYRQELTKFEYGISLAAALMLLDDPPARPGRPDRLRPEGPPEPGAGEQAVAARQHPVAAGQAQAGGNDDDRGEPAPGRQHDPAPQPGDALQRPAGRPGVDLEGHPPAAVRGARPDHLSHPGRGRGRVSLRRDASAGGQRDQRDDRGRRRCDQGRLPRRGGQVSGHVQARLRPGAYRLRSAAHGDAVRQGPDELSARRGKAGLDRSDDAMEMSLMHAGLAAGARTGGAAGDPAPVHAADAQARHLPGAAADPRAAEAVEEADAGQELAAAAGADGGPGA